MKLKLSIKNKQELRALLAMMPLAELSTTLSLSDIRNIRDLDRDVAGWLMQIRFNVNHLEGWLDANK